uniref:Protein kinase domain-containing protein n=1 Tax=Rhabditophanes sp. KR3021 TaxID=114890 RepID=A0AC35U568_9BILA
MTALNNLSNSIRFVKMRAKVDNIEEMEAMIFKFTESLGRRSQIEAIYFNSPFGVLKIRKYAGSGNYGEMLFYERGLKKNSKFIGEVKYSSLENSNETTSVLSYALGNIEAIKVLRRQFEKDNIVINLDSVEGLGCFMSLKFILNNNDISEEAALIKMKETMASEFNFTKRNILPFGTYLDLMKTNGLEDSDYDDEHTSDSSVL